MALSDEPFVGLKQLGSRPNGTVARLSDEPFVGLKHLVCRPTVSDCRPFRRTLCGVEAQRGLNEYSASTLSDEPFVGLKQ